MIQTYPKFIALFLGSVRDPNDASKLAHLKEMKNADTNLKLFKLDFDNTTPQAYDDLLAGCTAVLHMATPPRATAAATPALRHHLS